MEATSRLVSHGLVMQLWDAAVGGRDGRLGVAGPRCIASTPAGGMSQTSWQGWPAWLRLAALPKTSPQLYSRCSAVQKCRISNQVNDRTVSSESDGDVEKFALSRLNGRQDGLERWRDAWFTFFITDWVRDGRWIKSFITIRMIYFLNNNICQPTVQFRPRSSWAAV